MYMTFLVFTNLRAPERSYTNSGRGKATHFPLPTTRSGTALSTCFRIGIFNIYLLKIIIIIIISLFEAAQTRWFDAITSSARVTNKKRLFSKKQILISTYIIINYNRCNQCQLFKCKLKIIISIPIDHYKISKYICEHFFKMRTFKNP